MPQAVLAPVRRVLPPLRLGPVAAFDLSVPVVLPALSLLGFQLSGL